MYGNVGRSKVSMQGLVPLEAIPEIIAQIQNPVKKEKPIEADGGAYRAYCYNVLKGSGR